MPTSNPQMLVNIGNEIIKRNPNSFLDLGIGFGKYGLIAREYTDIWNRKNYLKKDWEVIIDGVDIHKFYISDHHKYIYNTLYNQDIVSFILKYDGKPYDMTVCLDVIEHVPQEQGVLLLDALKTKMGYTVISTPLEPGTRKGGQFGNKHEAHISKWTPEFLENYGNVYIQKCTLQTGLTDSLVVLEINR